MNVALDVSLTYMSKINRMLVVVSDDDIDVNCPLFGLSEVEALAGFILEKCTSPVGS